MRFRIVASGCLTAVIAAGIAGQAVVASSRDSAYDKDVRALQAMWDTDIAAGVPASAIDPLRNQLNAARVPGWWSADWWRNSPEQLLTSLRARTQEVWDTALARARDRIDLVLTDARDLITTHKDMVPTPFAAGVDTWPDEIAAAPNPNAAAQLAARYTSELTDAKTKTRAAEADAAAKAAAAAEAARVAKYGGVLSLIDQASKLDAVASADNLDISNVDALAAQAQQLVNANQDSTAVAAHLGDAIAAFRNLVNQNDQVGGAMQPLEWEIMQAATEGTPTASTFKAQFDPLQKLFADARTADQMNAVAQQQAALKAAVDKELAASACGHPVPGGKVLVVNLSFQEMLIYQDGCVIRATPVTTGRPQLRTPAGDFHIFYKTSPFTMVSPWAKPSPFWYPTTTVTWVMEFAGGGYFIHDADWEATSAYGPGSEDNPYAASHGCIHVPTPTMQWLYSWTPTGTEVIITN